MRVQTQCKTHRLVRTECYYFVFVRVWQRCSFFSSASFSSVFPNSSPQLLSVLEVEAVNFSNNLINYNRQLFYATTVLTFSPTLCQPWRLPVLFIVSNRVKMRLCG
jgi:hypothetical protein